MTRKMMALLATLALVAAVAVGCGGGNTSSDGMAPEQKAGQGETTQPSVPSTGSDTGAGQGSSDGK